MAEKLDFDLQVKKNDLDKALDEGIKKTGLLEGSLSTALGVFGGQVLTKGFDLLVDGLQSVIAFGQEAVDAAAAQEVAVNNLNNALARSGNFSREASRGILDFAAALQATTVFEDDAVIASAALLQSLTKLNADGLKQGVAAAADFATVLGIDLETATRLVAKAAEGNTTALKRYGIEVKQGSTDAETFANTIKALNTQFGGAATAQLNTYSGSVRAANNAYADLLEPIGDIVVKNPLIVAAFNEAKNSINELNKDVTGSVPLLQSLLNDGLLAVSYGAQILLDNLDFLTVAFKAQINTLQAFGGLIAVNLVGPIEDLIDGVIFLGSKIPGLGDEFKNLENPIAGATDSLVRFTEQAVDGAANATETNVFRQLSEGVDQFTQKTIESSFAVAKAQAEDKKNGQQRVEDEKVVSEEILNQRAKLGSDLLVLQSQLASEQKTFQDNLNALDLEQGIVQDTAKIDAIYQQKLRENEAILQGQLAEAKLIKDNEVRKLTEAKANQTFALANQKAFGDKSLALKVSQNAEDIKNQDSFFSSAISLSNSKNKEIAAIGKAAALTQLAIKTPEAVGNSFAFGTKVGGPVLGFALGAIAATAMAAQAAQIAGVAFANGGFINGAGGATMGPDTTTAEVRDGEMVLNASQQGKLFDMINGGGGGGDIVIKIDEREIARAVRNQRQQGFAI